jgi:hypothetical protein
MIHTVGGVVTPAQQLMAIVPGELRGNYGDSALN